MRSRAFALVCLPLAAAIGLGCSTAQPQLNIDPQADAALKRMSDELSKAKSFKLHTAATVEEALESGQMAQFSRDTTVVFVRPDRLQADVRHGPKSMRIWYEGQQLTVLDVGRNEYAVVKTPGNAGDMLDFLADEYDIILPMGDLLYPNTYKILTEHVKSGTYVDRQEIRGRNCDHLLFTQDNVDWQIWIDCGSPAVPRRLVITDRSRPDQPQFEATLESWQMEPAIDSSLFTPKLPANARRVEITDLTEAK